MQGYFSAVRQCDYAAVPGQIFRAETGKHNSIPGSIIKVSDYIPLAATAVARHKTESVRPRAAIKPVIPRAARD